MAHGIQHSFAPKSLHIREPSTHIDWNGCGVELLSSAKEWPSVDRPRRAAVSSFGIGGTNSVSIHGYTCCCILLTRGVSAYYTGGGSGGQLENTRLK